MKLAPINDGSAIISGGVLESADFTFEIDGQMFKILSDTLYQNKIGSMVREVSCNAMDSHVQAGKPDVPFIIHAPSKLEPWFSVKDQGLGLSFERMKLIYTRMGKSTKRDANDAIGCFGFGSKSPFAYAQSFTVTSVYNGVRYNCVAALKEDAVPCMMLLEQEETDEPNGLEVQVAVADSDHTQFANEIMQQLRWMKVKPTVVNNPTIRFEDYTERFILSAGALNFYKKSNSYGNAKAWIVQGGVSYPLDYSELYKKLDALKERELYSFMTDIMQKAHEVTIRFDIGEIEVTPSRESVSYSDKTVNNIITKIREAQSEIIRVVEAKIDALPTMWERCKFLNENKDVFMDIVKKEQNKWGIKFQSHYRDGMAYIPASEILPPGQRDANGNLVSSYHVDLYTMQRSGRRGRGKLKLSCRSAVDAFIPNDDLNLIVDDMCGYAEKRLNTYLEGYGKENYKMAVLRHTSHGATVPVDDTLVLDIFTKLHVDQFKLLSEYPRPVRQYTPRATSSEPREAYKAAKMYQFCGFSDEYPTHSLKNFEKVFISAQKNQEGGCYVTVDNKTVSWHLDTGNMSLFRHVRAAELFDEPVYAIREKDIEKIKGDARWVPLNDRLIELKAELVEKYKKQYVRAAIMAFRYEEMGGDIFCKDFIKRLVELNCQVLDKDVLKYMRQYKAGQVMKRHEDEAECQWLFGVEMEAIATRLKEKRQVMYKVIHGRYPLGHVLSSWSYQTDVFYTEFVKYMNATYPDKIACIVQPATV